MATRRANAKPTATERLTCKDCVHSEEWQCKGADGSMILCRCKHHKWCKFLRHDYCEHFTRRQ